MAKKDTQTYNVPLRREFIRTPKYKRAKRAVSALRNFLKKHMKVEDVKIGPKLNEKIWERGIKNPPHHVKITAIKKKDTVEAELEGIKYTSLKVKEKETKEGGLKGKLKKMVGKKESIEELAEGKKQEEQKKEDTQKQKDEKEEQKLETKKETTKVPEERGEKKEDEPKKDHTPGTV